MKNSLSMILLWLAILPIYSGAVYGEEHLRLATTTSTDNSGLLKVLHPPFEKKYNIKVDVIAVGTGKALRLGENGDVDLVLVHAPGAEKSFVEAGYGLARLPVMHNDFVLLGPEGDVAHIKQATSIEAAFTRLAAGKAAFISRGDDSGTHKKEMSLWRQASIEPHGDWYLAVGQGMGAVLKIANDKFAYTLSDRGTYLAYRDKIELRIVYEGAKALYNPYHLILINPEKHPHTKLDLAQKYADFIRGEEGQRLIREYKVADEQLFYPDVIK